MIARTMIWRTAKLTDVSRSHRASPARATGFGRWRTAAERSATTGLAMTSS
jgi:hypothetical protein